MGAHAHFFHHAPKPVSVGEFRDVLLATCKPRWPNARMARPRRVALAISGGADSMAMAYLFSQYTIHWKATTLGDHPFETAFAFVVDHGLRPGSDIEARKVIQNLRRIHVRGWVRTLNWRKMLKADQDPKAAIANIETAARRMRYQNLGRSCLGIAANSLFIAHHRDDQYETVLMRLLSGHGYRGLQGMRDANPIPECYDLHQVYQSGLVDDQLKSRSYLSFKAPNSELKALRRAFKDERNMNQTLISSAGQASRLDLFPGKVDRIVNPDVPYVIPLTSEDGGVMVYRPLLEFDKDRLVATCQANNIPWVEDHTNQDPTFTLRNAVRHLVRNHELPKALQKPSILALARKSRRRVQFEEAEASRFITRNTIIKDFDPNVGTLLIELPSLRPEPSSRETMFTKAREEARRPHRRIIAAIAIRKLIDFVTPEDTLPPLTNLENVVNRLFPDLSLEEKPYEPKAFGIAGVLFDPVVTSTSTKWFLSRTPYPANRGVPRLLISVGDYDKKPETTKGNKHIAWRSWKKFRQFDGRFWAQVAINVDGRFAVEPLYPGLVKPFRMALPEKERTKLDRVLKYYAPGKVRYALPAIYSIELDSHGPPAVARRTLLALPSLGIHVPGMERWVKYDFRYRKVDTSLLAAGQTTKPKVTHSAYRRSPGASQRRRDARMSRHRLKKRRV